MPQWFLHAACFLETSGSASYTQSYTLAAEPQLKGGMGSLGGGGGGEWRSSRAAGRKLQAYEPPAKNPICQAILSDERDFLPRTNELKLFICLLFDCHWNHEAVVLLWPHDPDANFPREARKTQRKKTNVRCLAKSNQRWDAAPVTTAVLLPAWIYAMKLSLIGDRLNNWTPVS